MVGHDGQVTAFEKRGVSWVEDGLDSRELTRDGGDVGRRREQSERQWA